MSTARLDSEVIVVGGGPAGAATAWWLARAGIDVLVLDRARFPRSKPCSEYLSPQAARLLDEMGALQLVEAAGAAKLTGMRVHTPNGGIIDGRFAGRHGFRGFRDHGLALRRELLDAILLDRARAAGARVLEEAAVIEPILDGGRVVGVRVREQNGIRDIHARLVVGADGLRSVIARRLHLGRRAAWPRRLAIVAHYRGLRDVLDAGEMYVRSDGYCGIAAVNGDVCNVAVVVPAPREHLEGGSAQLFEQWIARDPRLAPRFASATRVSEPRATGPFAWKTRRAWAPGAALVGDAADFFDPFTGEGIYAALRGGELLAGYAFEAARQSAPRADVALAAYDRCRRDEFGGKWRVERLAGAAVSAPWLLDHAARAMTRDPAMADLFVGVTGDFVPPREVLRPGYVARLMLGGFSGDLPPTVATPSSVRA